MTSAVTIAPGLEHLRLGGHLRWTVDDDESYLAGVDFLLGLAERRNEKPVLFGPEAGGPPRGLARHPAAWADPRTAFLGGGPLVPATMFSAFGQQIELARSEGYTGLMAVADMDWLLSLEPSIDELISFELLLDRRINELGATVVCAYRSASFDRAMLAGTSCVHPIDAGGPAPQFRFIAGPAGGWRLSGEVDFDVAGHFESAVRGATSCGDCEIDVSELDFMDVAALRATVRGAGGSTIRFSNAKAVPRRIWHLSRYADEVPTVQFVD